MGLRIGALVERPLYIWLTSNKRFIQMVKALHPLEQTAVDKFKRYGNVYSPVPAFEKLYGGLIRSIHEIRDILDVEDTPNYSTHSKVLELTKWLVPHAWPVLEKIPVPASLKASEKIEEKSANDGQIPPGVFPPINNKIPVIFIHRILGVPRQETLHHLAEHSIVMYERALVTAAHAGLYAIWLGFLNKEMLSKFIEVIFCEEISLSEANHIGVGLETEGPIELSDTELKASLDMLAKGEVPGVGMRSKRSVVDANNAEAQKPRPVHIPKAIRNLMESRTIQFTAGDELAEVLALARARAHGQLNYSSELTHTRVFKKLDSTLRPLFVKYLAELEKQMEDEKLAKAKKEAA